MRLISVGAAENQSTDPTHRTGFSAEFVISKRQGERLAKTGGKSVYLWHHALGSALVFVNAYPMENGSYRVLAVFN